MIAKYTQKQIDKYNRQKYIGELEKIAKNLFKMFREEQTHAEGFVQKFSLLKEKLDEKVAIPLDSEYLRRLQEYIDRLYVQTCKNAAFDNDTLEDIREAEMSNLNRLQKMKNGVSYKKEKHKTKYRHEDWG